MFHHYLNSGYRDPATALRAVQRWMLDERRKLPERMSRRLADALAHYDLTQDLTLGCVHLSGPMTAQAVPTYPLAGQLSGVLGIRLRGRT